ncbi:hypothetical protein O181_076310 [Austropuccinia psidii MF-1]|uniref:Retrovirus-related Pol polyprotein from transposon TNT 1-94-like beta-barrel domain-containing protein n=1 Tax=Austropuccinia psidii MF-1 TaxID=1389203 RepID=A0A9Q3F8E9_9BASI|nr:hypothetical protein [Austropuccinia psidii MF-1]
MNKEIIERPDLILSLLQEYVNHLNTKAKHKPLIPSALVSVSDHPYKITYYCPNGQHNIKCTTHTKEKCYSEHPHLRPLRQEKKRNMANFNKPMPSLHLSSAESLATFASKPSSHQRLVVDCGATHHMFNYERFFTKLSISNNLKVSTGDPYSLLLPKGVGTVFIICDGRKLQFDDCLFVPKLKCNLISLLNLFSKKLTIIKQESTFCLNTNGTMILGGSFENHLILFNYSLPETLLTKASLWHN